MKNFWKWILAILGSVFFVLLGVNLFSGAQDDRAWKKYKKDKEEFDKVRKGLDAQNESDKQKLEEFHYLSEILPWIRIFELGKEKNWEVLEKAVSVKFPQAIEGNEFIYVVYFDDDLFNLEEEEIYKLLGIFKRASDTLQIYFLTTSPSWIFSQRDLDDNRKKFGLVASRNTPIGGLDDDDRKALKAQSQAMYGEVCRSDLLELIDSEEETLILLKLALHQNLTYSAYLESMFHKLETPYVRRLVQNRSFEIWMHWRGASA